MPVDPALAALASALLDARLSAQDDLTKEGFAKRAGLGRNTVERIFKGIQVPTRSQVHAIARACNVNPASFDRLYEELQRSRMVAGIQTAPEQREVDGQSESLVIQYHDNTEAFYTAAAAAVQAATEQIRVTYIRQHPPTRYASLAARNYFATVLDWAEPAATPSGSGVGTAVSASRSVRRIIGLPIGADGKPGREFLNWLRAHNEEVREITAYEANVLEWTPGVDWINMALIDDSVTFLTFSGAGAQQLKGLSSESRRFLTPYAEFFERVWQHTTALDEYLRNKDATA
ncbi:helix-turn-helix domain-containing protein [Frankia tisae]|uniref:helix-turn-helix domain-containing protein n=1 Tax=Frankia tisae TaxID=2950104 RepID=UPI0021BEE956|nr:helix-turn-helix domain-containing protein [Frankia tisae]